MFYINNSAYLKIFKTVMLSILLKINLEFININIHTYTCQKYTCLYVYLNLLI